MRILVDENIPFMTVKELCALGHNVIDIRGTEREGMSDDDLWIVAQKEKRLLITTDKGFVRNRNERHHGILIIRLKQPNRLKIHQKVIKGIGLFKEEEWARTTVVMKDMFHSTWKAKKKG
jgi:predicted nuclease of predicted toxin-antitoxin system